MHSLSFTISLLFCFYFYFFLSLLVFYIRCRFLSHSQSHTHASQKCVRFIPLPLSSHSVASHTPNSAFRSSWHHPVQRILCVTCSIIQHHTASASVAKAVAMTTTTEQRRHQRRRTAIPAMDNHDAIYVFILHVESTLQRENVICIFHEINRRNGRTSHTTTELKQTSYRNE